MSRAARRLGAGWAWRACRSVWLGGPRAPLSRVSSQPCIAVEVGGQAPFGVAEERVDGVGQGLYELLSGVGRRLGITGAGQVS